MLGDQWWSIGSEQADADGAGTDISRRTLLRAGGALGGGLLLAIALPVPAIQAANAREGDFSPGAFVRIDRSGAVTLTVPQVEMGQGIYTTQAMLVADELDVDLAQVTVEHAPADDRLYGNPLLGFQVTGGSTSVRAFYLPLRRGRRRRPHDADRGGGRALGGRCHDMHDRERHRGAPTDAPPRELWRAGRSCRRRCRSRRRWR